MIPADKRQIRQWLREYADEAITSPHGAHPVALVFRLLDEHPEVRDQADELLEDALRGWASEAIKPKRMETAQLPGLGDPCPITVTAPDGEGGYVVKSIRLATVADLVADVAIHEENVSHALQARRLAARRNDRLVPLMEEHGFELAGDALDLLEQQGDPPPNPAASQAQAPDRPGGTTSDPAQAAGPVPAGPVTVDSQEEP